MRAIYFPLLKLKRYLFTLFLLLISKYGSGTEISKGHTDFITEYSEKFIRYSDRYRNSGDEIMVNHSLAISRYILDSNNIELAIAMEKNLLISLPRNVIDKKNIVFSSTKKMKKGEYDPPGAAVSNIAGNLVDLFNKEDVTYSMKKDEHNAYENGTGKTSDCSSFVREVFKKSGYEVDENLNTKNIENNSNFERVEDIRKVEAGDVIVQGRNHMGVCTGNIDIKGRIECYQMGKSGAKLGEWSEKKGWFGKGRIEIYRYKYGKTNGNDN